MGNQVPRILFAISDTGSGHRSAAVAIVAAIQNLVGSSVECHIVDMLASSGVPVVRSAPEVYDQMRDRWLALFDLAYQVTDGRRRVDALTWMLYFSAHRNILRVLEQIQPTMVVSVHPLTNRFIANTRRVYRLSFHFITVVTDLVSLHASWADPQAELCIVPTQEAFERQHKEGLPLEKLLLTGFPVHPKFATYNRTRDAAREALGIHREQFTVLMTSGGVDSSQARELLRELTQTYRDLQFLYVTGKNAALREALVEANLGANVRIYGFVNNMEELMGASDLVITKAGPGTLMEALVIGRPVIITEAVGMQERGNIDFVLNYELGAYCPTPDRIVAAVAELMQPDVYVATAARLQDAVPRDGAIEIARALIGRLQLVPPTRRRRFWVPSIISLGNLRTRIQLPRRRRAARRLRPRLQGLERLGLRRLRRRNRTPSR